MIVLNYIIAMFIFIYVISAIAVGVWDNITKKEQFSWINNEEIFIPLYNTLMAISLWRHFNPFNKNKK